MLFNKHECNMLISALDEYNVIPRGVFQPQKQRCLVVSCIKKLSSKTPELSFTADEITVMSLSLKRIIDMYQKAHANPELDYIPLASKISSIIPL